MSRGRTQFLTDDLVQQVCDGRKTASVVALDHADVREDDYNDRLVVGRTYDVYDSQRVMRASIRIKAMEVCRWDDIPERLWRGEVCATAEEFRQHHLDYFGGDIAPEFEFVAYYFELAPDRE